jgi:chromosome segregation ATPase
MNEDIASLQAAIESMRIELNEATDKIEDLRFQLQGTQDELDSALSRERTLLKDQEDYRIGADNLEAEIERLKRDYYKDNKK